MRFRISLMVMTALFLSTTRQRAEEPSQFLPGTLPRHTATMLPWTHLWPVYGYPGFGTNVFSRYDDTPNSPYLYFYEQYAREAEESRRAADEYEASLAREGKLTGPLPVGASTTDFLPRSPLNQQVTLDGQTVDPSPSGAPLVIESGLHTLQIGALAGNPEN